MRSLPALFALALAAMLAPGPAAAQGFPNRAITLIIPFAAGGPTDVVARILGESMSRTLGQPIVIENVTGGGGTTGALRAANAAPDGHTLLIGHTGTHAAAVALNPDLRYDPLTSFEPVGLVNTNPILIVARRGLPADTLPEFVAYLKANTSRVNNAHAGIGSVSHTTCLMLHNVLGVRPTEVPYRGTGPAMNDIVAGQVDYLCDQIVNVAPQAKAGTIKTFAVAQARRSSILPDVPTTTEAGLPEYQVTVWNAMFLPKGTPAPIVAQVGEALNTALRDEGTRRRLDELGAEIPTPEQMTSAGLRAFIKGEIDRWTPVIKAAGVTMR